MKIAGLLINVSEGYKTALDFISDHLGEDIFNEKTQEKFEKMMTWNKLLHEYLIIFNSKI